MKIILASASPRRRELLTQMGLEFEVRPSCGEEVITARTPAEAVMELAGQKAAEIAGIEASERPGEDLLVIGADTVVSVDGAILGKPGTPERAAGMIRRISGRSHQVYTGVSLILCLEGGRTREYAFAEKTDVHVYPMDEDEIRAYAESGEPLDKAGGYGIQGRFAAYIRGIDGDYGNVVGLPLGRLCHAVKEFLG